MLPKIYEVKHPRTPWLVVYSDPTERRNGKPKRVQKWFKLENEAREHHAKLMKTAANVGTSGLSMDARARADYYSARQILDVAGHTMSVTEAVREFVKSKPAGAQLAIPVAELIPLFVAAKEVEENRSAAQVSNLRKRVTAWVREQGIVTLRDINEESMLAIKQRKHAWRSKRTISARTRINDMAAVSTFLSWLKERRLRASNELLDMSRPQTDTQQPRVLKPDQVRGVLEAAMELENGRLLKWFALLLLAGLRPNEAAQVRPEQVRLTAKPAFVRVVRGKKRNRPRPAPLLKNFRSWWNAAAWPTDENGQPGALFDWQRDRTLFDRIREKAGLLRLENSRRKANLWQGDICRHTWISVRLQQTKDEAQVAYEGGTSVGMIHGHYLDTLDDAQVAAIERIRPPKRDLTAAQQEITKAA